MSVLLKYIVTTFFQYHAFKEKKREGLQTGACFSLYINTEYRYHTGICSIPGARAFGGHRPPLLLRQAAITHAPHPTADRHERHHVGDAREQLLRHGGSSLVRRRQAIPHQVRPSVRPTALAPTAPIPIFYPSEGFIARPTGKIMGARREER